MAELNTIQLGQTEYDIRDANALPKPTTSPSLPPSGTALTANTLYNVDATVNTYSFTPPVGNSWAHGIFATGTTPNITFTGAIIGKLPDFAADKVYEFDVYDGIWAVQEVVTQ